MSEHIDHAARAADHIVRACHPDVTKTLSHAMVAQAEATLALVEQQRIANLIALATSAGSPVLDLAAQRALLRINSEDYSPEVAPGIREALGLS